MNTGTTRINEWKNNISGAATAAIGWLTGRQAKAEPSQQRRQRLLSAFLVVMGLMTLSGAVFFKNMSANLWTVMLVTSLVLFAGFFISRTRYHQAAVILAITVPAINPLAVFIFKLPEINLLATLMWLALPLLVSSLMMTVRKTLIVAAGYIVYISLLAILGPINHEISIPLIAYICIIAFFVLTISVVREKDQMEMANELKERQRAEKALRVSEDKFRNLFENAKDTIILADTQTGNIVDVNTAGCRLLDLPKEKIIGKHQSELHPPELAEKYKQLFQDHIQKGSVITEDIIVQRADGTQIPMDVSANVVKLADKTIIQGIFRDMTERVHMAKTIRESEEKFTKVFRLSPLEICITRIKDGKTVEINDSFTRFSGYTREEIIGRTSTELGIWTKPEDRQKMLKLLKKDGRVHNAEFEFCNKNGEVRTYLFSAEPTNFNGEECIISIMTDITDRKKIEKSLRESEEKFSKAFHASPQEIIITRAKDNVTLEVNDSYTHVTGFSREETIGHTAEEIGVWMKPEDHERQQRILKEQGRINNEEFEFLNKKGEKHTELISVEPITLSGEECWISILTDITERKQMEEDLANEAIWRRILIEQSSDGIVIIDQNGKVYEANRRFTEMLGYSPEEVRELYVFDWEYQFPREQVLDMIRTIDENGDHFETRHRRKDGTTFDVEISSNGAVIAGEKLIFCVCRDITERKKMEEALANEAIWRRILIEQSRDGIVVLDQNGGVYEANQRFIEMNGYSGKEISQLHVWDWDTQYTQQEFVDRIRDINEAGDLFETQHRRKDGTTFNVEISSNGAMFAGQKLILCVCRDVTERKKMEELQKAENRVLTLLGQGAELNKLLDAIMSLCEKNDPSIKGSIMLYDSSKNWLTGYSPSLPDEYNAVLKAGIPAGPNVGSCGTAAHRKQRVVVPEIKKSPLFKPHQGAVELANKYGLQAVWSEPVISSSGELLGTIANYSDHVGKPTAENLKVLEWSARIAAIAIERKHMEQALRESEEKFSTAFHAIPESVSIATKKDGMFIDVNESFCRHIGYTYEEVIGHRIEELRTWAEPEERSRMQLLQKQGHFENEELDIMNQSGEKRTILMSGDTINIGGEPCFLLVGNDITERKMIERALRESEEKFSKAFHAIPEAISISRIKDGIFLDVNESFCRGKEHSREDLLGHTSEELKLWAKPGERDKMIRLVKKNGGIINQELEFPSKSGEIQTLLFSAEIINIGGEPCLLTIGNDITKRKKNQQALKESEEKFSKAFHAVPLALSISRMKDGIFLDVNESFCRANGHTPEEAIGHTAEEIGLWAKPEDLDRLNQLMEKQGHFENNEFEFRVKSGEIRTVLVSSDIIDIGGEPCVLTIGNDITERKMMERALRESEEKFSKAFHGIPESVSISRLKDGVFLDINDSFLVYNNLTRKEVIGHTAEEMNLWVESDERNKIARLMSDRGFFDNEEFEFKQESGKTRTLLLSGDIINVGGEPCLLTIGNDISKRKQMENALRESEEKFSKAFRAFSDAVSIATLKDGVFLEVNDNFLSLNGYTREEVIGHASKELDVWVNPEDRYRIKKLIETHGRFENEEFLLRRKSGEMRTVLLSAEIINIGSKPCILTAGKDITERKQVEQALRESEEKFSKAFHASPEAIVISNIEDGTILDANETFLQHTGYTSKGVLGKKASGMSTWAMPEERAEMVNILKEKGSVRNREYHFRMKSGEIRVWLFSADIVNINNRQSMLSVTTDITERKRMEQALRESEEKFSKAFHAIPETLSISTLKEGKFIDVNESFLKLNKLTREKVIGRTSKEVNLLKPGDKRNKLREILNKHSRFNNEEIEFKAPSGKMLTFLFSADTINIAGEPCLLIIGNDITKRKQTEKNLQNAMADLELSSAHLQATNKELESFSYSVSHDLRSPLRSIDGFSQALLEDYSAKLDETGQDYLNRLRVASQKMGELIDGLLKLSRLTRSEMHHEKVDLSSLASEITTRLQETFPKRSIEFIVGSDLTANGDPQMLRVLLENLLTNALKFTKNTKKARIEFGSKVDGERKTFFIKDNGAGFDMAFRDKLFGAFQRLHDTAEYPGTGIGLATVQRIINRHGGSVSAEGAVGEGATFYFTLN